ncbi:hypothetical protein [Chroococcidiopsis sp. CCMEE 29]|uniref:hypothetical protein n=1 Tax=Chroococcidiopsis sp. CCMEE 29 TaxID=155894 RepID=UPI0020217D30|nr:hypothetical protein [Chroococcidiopsis sp. CCMEE 29]
MTGQDYQCPNAEICLKNSSKHSMAKMVLFMLNQQMCQLEEIQVSGQPLSELMQQFDQDLESLLTSLESLDSLAFVPFMNLLIPLPCLLEQ